MTLHWWMHWFWVTTLLTLIASSGPCLAAPQSEELQHITTNTQAEHRVSERQNRAMYYTKTPPPTTQVPNTTETQTETEPQTEMNASKNNTANGTMETVQPSVQWTPVNTTETNSSLTPQRHNQDANSTAISSTNVTETQNATFTAKKRNLTRPAHVNDHGTSVAESSIVSEKPLSLETAFVQTRIPPSVESSRRMVEPGEGGMDMGAIAGISFAALVLAALAGSTAFVLYRRRYLNKPQTLNDKCSNPDSSGYLDDSTIRDNSEEMYSLDNDSFLNSLEAMTIQNYWTDTVKHTKL